jgi:polysaccharide pyruvyl transferase WcaK-like protein
MDMTQQKPRVRLLNWSGHGNLGDDEMDRILRRNLEASGIEVTNEHYDWTIIGGGTLIAPASEYIREIENPSRTILFSVGVSSNWEGAHLFFLARCHRIYTRDLYSQKQLERFEIHAKASFDLWFDLELRQWLPYENKIAANFIRARESVNPSHQELADTLSTVSALKGFERFALSPIEDMEQMGDKARLFTDGQELIDYLSTCGTVYTDRLHATVAAWIAGVKDIRPLFYDPKICHFLEYARLYTPEEAQETLRKDLQSVIETIKKES